jgi:hypothetical protein
MAYQSNIQIAYWPQIDLASVGDQIMNISASKYVIKRVVAANITGTVTGAAGGMYTAANKGGTNIVPATQTYSGALPNRTLDLTLAANITTTVLTGSQIFLTLTTKSSTAARCDIYVIADTLD